MLVVYILCSVWWSLVMASCIRSQLVPQFMPVCAFIHVHIYIQRERERELLSYCVLSVPVPDLCVLPTYPLLLDMFDIFGAVVATTK